MSNPFDVDKSTIAPGAEVRLRCVEGHVVFQGKWSEAQKHLKTMCARCDAGDLYEEDLDDEDRELRAEIVPPPPPPVPVVDWRARAEKAEADFLACAQAAGIVYEAEGHASAPGPVERVVEAIREGRRAENVRDDLRAALEVALAAMQANIAYANRKDERALARGIRAAQLALSSDAGRNLLKERDELRRAVEGAIARLSEGGLADGSARVGDVVAELRTVIAAWEKRHG